MGQPTVRRPRAGRNSATKNPASGVVVALQNGRNVVQSCTRVPAQRGYRHWHRHSIKIKSITQHQHIHATSLIHSIRHTLHTHTHSAIVNIIIIIMAITISSYIIIHISINTFYNTISSIAWYDGIKECNNVGLYHVNNNIIINRRLNNTL